MTWHPAPVTPSGARGLRPIPIALPWKDLGIKKGSHLDTVFVSQKNTRTQSINVTDDLVPNLCAWTPLAPTQKPEITEHHAVLQQRITLP